MRNLPESTYDWLDSAPDERLAEQFAKFERSGLLEVPDPQLAVKHFSALTFLLVFNNMRPDRNAEEDGIRKTIMDGVRVFLRAYSPQRT